MSDVANYHAIPENKKAMSVPLLPLGIVGIDDGQESR